MTTRKGWCGPDYLEERTDLQKQAVLSFLSGKPVRRPAEGAGLPAQAAGHLTGKYSEQLCCELCGNGHRAAMPRDERSIASMGLRAR